MFFKRSTSSSYDSRFASARVSASSSFDSSRSNLSTHNILGVNSPSNRIESNSFITQDQQPIANPHAHLLDRSLSNCPSDLSDSQRTRWINAGKKAEKNQQLLNTYPRFNWPLSFYDQPIHIHKHTSEFFLQGLIYKTSNVRLFVIDTESDKPTRYHPISRPALIQIQAIHHQELSTVFLIEVQHLPYSSSRLFHLIRTLCDQIFAPSNTLIGWGDIICELRSFASFQLFDINQLIHTIDLQQLFTGYWNKTHPHTPDCTARHQSMSIEPESDDVLICLINTDDLDNEVNTVDGEDDFNECCCPDIVRPYKQKNVIWSLQTAIEHIFHQALDKTMTFNFWSCGLDIHLNTWRTIQDKETRSSLISYAINDVFAVTSLYYHVLNHPPQHSSPVFQLNSISSIDDQILPTLFFITDSHGKFFPPISNSSKYRFLTRTISGLQWNNQTNHELSLFSLFSSSSFSSSLITCFGVILLVGTNSIRTYLAADVILQISDIIDFLRSNHSHLTRKNRITIISAFPCLKPSYLFPNNFLLMNNINEYNSLLYQLSVSKCFTFLTTPITLDYLQSDGMHLNIEHVPYLFQFIQQSIDSLLSNSNTNRSPEARQRRNAKRHRKLRQKQMTQTVIRSIAPIWELHVLKAYLQFKHIRVNRIPEIRKHKLCLRFSHQVDQQYAEHNLSQDEFNISNYHRWLAVQP